MYSTGFVLKLKEGCYDEYKRRHDNLWPEMADLIAENGLEMFIYRLGEMLFVYSTAPSKEAWDRAEQDPLTARWDAYMRDVLESDENGKIEVTEMPLVFACSGTHTK